MTNTKVQKVYQAFHHDKKVEEDGTSRSLLYTSGIFVLSCTHQTLHLKFNNTLTGNECK